MSTELYDLRNHVDDTSKPGHVILTAWRWNRIRERYLVEAPVERADVDALLKPFDKAAKVLANSDWSTPREDAEFEDSIEAVRAALTRPDPLKRLEAWLRIWIARRDEYGHFNWINFCSATQPNGFTITLQDENGLHLGTGSTLPEAIEAALAQAGAK